MKKKYIKPIIIVEKFSLCRSIAGDCEETNVPPTEGTCAISGTGDINIFTESMEGICEAFPPDGKYNEICYHVPDGGPNMFNS